MDVRGVDVAGACYHCGAALPAGAQYCPYCGMAATPGSTSTSAIAPASAGVATTAATFGPASAPPQPVGVAAGPVGHGGPQLLLAPADVSRTLPQLSRKALTIIGVVVLVLAGGGVAYAVLKPDAPSGEVTIRKYFNDLAEGDTKQALSRVFDAEQYRVEEYPLLDGKALADERNRPADLKVLRSEPVSNYGGAEVQNVEITYRLGDTTVNQTIMAGRESGDEGDFWLAEPFLRFGVQNAGARKVTINGITVDAETAQGTYVFPGVYAAEAHGSVLVTGDSRAAVVRGTSAGAVAVVTFDKPALAPGAQDAISRQVKQIIDKCAESTSAEPHDCPFGLYLFDTNTSVAWKIVSYPTIVATLSSFGRAEVDVRSRSHDGVVHYDATYTDSTGVPRTDSGEQRFGVSGTASAVGSTITVSIN